MPSIEQVITDMASRCQDVGIKLCRALPTVVIHDLAGDQFSIYMDGPDAQEFVKQLDELIEAAPDVTMDQLIKCVASPYVENYWN
jgi:ABC-type uncharacterized transport system permease subunit